MNILSHNEIIILVGGPGCGKGTICALLAERYKAVHISSGELFRSKAKPLIREAIRQGDFAPENEFIALLTNALELNQGLPIIFDGITKKPNEAKWLLGYLAETGRNLKQVFYLEIDQTTAMNRIMAQDRGREDDTEAIHHYRWSLFEKCTLESIHIYRQKGIMTTIDASLKVNEMIKQISDRIDSSF